VQESKQKRIFIGGLLKTHEHSHLYEYFAKFGQIDKAFIIKDSATGESRCFGFVEFVEKAAVDDVLDMDTHKIKGKKVECKPFIGTKMNQYDKNLFDDYSKKQGYSKNSSSNYQNKNHKNQKNYGFGKGGVYDSDLESDKS